MSAKRIRTPIKRRRKKSLKHLRHIDPASIAAQQGIKPMDNPDELYADFWPKEESADDFVRAVRQWRKEGKTRRSS